MKEIRSAEILITKAAQAKCYEKEISILREGQEKEGMKVGSLHRLDPFLDRNGLRVGGRIKRSNLPPEVKFPVILPRKSHLANLIISYFHGRVEHQGRGITLNEIRSNGYWVIGGTAAVAHCISRCVKCNRSRGATQEPKMADLPNDRMEPSPPFTYAAVDYCGPWYIKDGRKEVKSYIALFTCMASRAVHLEVARSLEADSFLDAFRRLISRRGPVRQLRCDQGTNCVYCARLSQVFSTIFAMWGKLGCFRERVELKEDIAAVKSDTQEHGHFIFYYRRCSAVRRCSELYIE